MRIMTKGFLKERVRTPFLVMWLGIQLAFVLSLRLQQSAQAFFAVEAWAFALPRVEIRLQILVLFLAFWQFRSQIHAKGKRQTEASQGDECPYSVFFFLSGLGILSDIIWGLLDSGSRVGSWEAWRFAGGRALHPTLLLAAYFISAWLFTPKESRL